MAWTLTYVCRIPYDRALDFANKEKITELLYPLFVHNIGALLYHPTNQPRTNQVMAAAERRKADRLPSQPTSSLPSLHHHHHPSAMALPGPQPGSSHPNMGRPVLDRAHTFPTPPTSASSAMGGMGTSDNFQWGQQGMNGAQPQNPMSIDTGLSNARSMPNTPATTPPGATIQSMQQYPPASQPYDSSRQIYPPSTQTQAYPASNATSLDRSVYGQGNYVKSGMGPPASRPAGAVDQADTKPPNGMMHPAHGAETVPQPGHEEEADHDHDPEYTHDSTTYDANRTQYNYNPPQQVASLPADHAHLSPELTGSPHQTGSGRATPRTAPAPQPYYTQGYNSPPRAQAPSSNLYNVMSSDRAPTNGAPGGDVYAPQADMGGSMSNGYAPQQPAMNGSSTGMKRGRDDEDDRPGSVGGMDAKRRKTFGDGSIPSATYETPMNRPASAIAGQMLR